MRLSERERRRLNSRGAQVLRYYRENLPNLYKVLLEKGTLVDEILKSQEEYWDHYRLLQKQNPHLNHYELDELSRHLLFPDPESLGEPLEPVLEEERRLDREERNFPPDQ